MKRKHCVQGKVLVKLGTVALAAGLVAMPSYASGPGESPGDPWIPGVELVPPLDSSKGPVDDPGADDPTGLIGAGRLAPVAALAATLSEDRTWLNPELVTMLDDLSLRLDEVFDGSPRYFSKEGALHEIKFDKVGEMWEGFDPQTDPYFIFLTHELYSDLGDDRVLGFQDGEEKVFLKEDFERLPAIGLAVSTITPEDEERVAFEKSASIAELGEGDIGLGNPRLEVSRWMPEPLTEEEFSPQKSRCVQETGLAACTSRGALVCAAGAKPFFVLKRIRILKEHEGIFRGHPDVEMFPFSFGGPSSFPSLGDSTMLIFDERNIYDAAGRRRLLPDVNKKYRWYSTDVALFPFDMSTSWVAALIEDDKGKGVFRTKKKKFLRPKVKIFTTPYRATHRTFVLDKLGFLKNLLRLGHIAIFGDGDDLWEYPMGITNALACSSGRSSGAPRTLWLRDKQWEMQGYFACINPSCKSLDSSLSEPNQSDNWTMMSESDNLSLQSPLE